MAAGARSFLAPWIGGAGSPSGAQLGYRSMLAFWSGGACNAGAAPPTPQPEPQRDRGSAGRGGGGGWTSTQWAPSRRITIDGSTAERELLDQEDDLMLQIIIQAVTRGLL